MIKRLILVLLLLVAACRAAPTEPPTNEPALTPSKPTTPPPTPTAQASPVLTPTVDPRDVRRAEGAGQWYPGDPDRLRKAVDVYLDQAEVDELPGRIHAVIVPHAGYLYSGAVAGHSLRALRNAGCTECTIAVIGDTHTGNGSADIAVWANGAFETPLGRVLVDAEVAQAVVDGSPRIEFDRAAFRSEHPVENQLPFIQVACPGARVVPIVIRKPSLANAQVLADALVAAFGDLPALIVASTDLSHYHPYDEARRIDEVALQAIASLDPQAVVGSTQRCAELGLQGVRSTMCSQGAVLTAIMATQQMGANRAAVLHYANSGDSPIGDRTGVVGYGAVAIWQAENTAGNPNSFTVPPAGLGANATVSLSPEAREKLLALARRSAEQFLTSETFPAFHTDDPAMLQPLGAYVTYEKEDMLRGCLGRLEADRPVYLSVQFAAAAAAVADSRFRPITPEELKTLTIEITLLHPMREVDGPEEIRIGRHGVLMRVGADDRALYLPQVAVQQGWNLEETLANLCLKADLPEDAWQAENARFWVFEGEWFGEEE